MKAQIKPRINLENRTRLEEVIPLATPMILFVDPASACNFECSFCPTGDKALIKETGRFVGRMTLDLFKKVIDDLRDFDRPIKVLRLYKDGEPFLNKNLAKMVDYAKTSGRVDYIDTTTNGSLIDPGRIGPVIEAGLDRINISVDGLNRQQYLEFTRFDFDFDAFLQNLKWLYAHKGNCEIAIKIPGELLSEEQTQEFYDLFGDYCDRISIENFAPCWPQFDVEDRTGVSITQGIYNQPITSTETCPYLFYSMSVNADGLVSSCFLDWGRKLIVGDARSDSLIKIWNSAEFDKLRLQHLEGRRSEHPVCGKCGQLTHCLPDSIDPYRQELLDRFKAHVAAKKY